MKFVKITVYLELKSQLADEIWSALFWAVAVLKPSKMLVILQKPYNGL